MLEVNYILEKVINQLPITSEASEEYKKDTVMPLLLAAMSKLEKEGVPNNFKEDSEDAYSYIRCIALQVEKDIDRQADLKRLDSLYITRVNSLREG